MVMSHLFFGALNLKIFSFFFFSCTRLYSSSLFLFFVLLSMDIGFGEHFKKRLLSNFEKCFKVVEELRAELSQVGLKLFLPRVLLSYCF